MKKLIKMLAAATVAATVSLLLLAGCEEAVPREESKGEKGVPHRAEYTEGDAEYVLSVEDDDRRICLDVSRSGGISVATVSSPEELYGLVITDDIDGVRLFPAESDAELTLSVEASGGLCVFFEIMEKVLSDEEYGEDECFEFMLGEHAVKLKLDENGYPCEAEVTRDGYVRRAAYEMRKIP